MNIRTLALALALHCPLIAPLHAAITPAPLFQDHAVLQHGKPVPVWGGADAGEKITVGFAGQSVTTTAGQDGRWSVTLKPLQPSAVPAVLTITGNETITFQDILVGEVWLASGQSNMEFPLSRHLRSTRRHRRHESPADPGNQDQARPLRSSTHHLRRHLETGDARRRRQLQRGRLLLRP